MGNIRLFLVTNFVSLFQNFAFKKKKICHVFKVKKKKKFKNIKINIGEVISDWLKSQQDQYNLGSFSFKSRQDKHHQVPIKRPSCGL